jgi:hypothetical protein
MKRLREEQQQQLSSQRSINTKQLPSLCPLPHTRNEFSISIQERWNKFLKAIDEATKTPASKDDNSASSTSNNIIKTIAEFSDQEWISFVQSSLQVRKELSYLMYQLSSTSLPQDEVLVLLGEIDDTTKTTPSMIQQILSTIQRLWIQLLEFPKQQTQEPTNDNITISLMIPMYKETTTTIQSTMQHTLHQCSHDSESSSSESIQVIIVHVVDDKNNNDDDNTTQKEHLMELQSYFSNFFGDFKVVTTTTSQCDGRGQTINLGLQHSDGLIFTVLHADTLLPTGWNQQIENALLPNPTTTTTSSTSIISCAFTMGIDLNDNYSTPGLLGAEWGGIVRCYCGLPYGDSVISFTKSFLQYIGGYPDQPLMEDYELMDWVRRRSLFLDTKCMKLLKEQTKCSPRRWQKYGVAYTTLINAICIYQYRHHNVSAEDLFDFYYHTTKSITTSANDDENEATKDKDL